MSEKITEEFPKLPVVDPDYEAYRARLDEENIEDGSELENEDYEDHEDGLISFLLEKKKPHEKTVPIFKRSDFESPSYKLNWLRMGYFIIFTQVSYRSMVS